MVFPKPTETCVLTVNGQDHTEWETISVQLQKNDFPFAMARFTTSEGAPFSKNLFALQIKPGDFCTVTLAGQLAFTGKVEVRQVYADAKKHHVEITAITRTEVATATVISKTMEWKQKTFKAIAEPLLKKLDMDLKFEGGPPPSYEFPRISAFHGQPVLDFLAETARSLPGNILPLSFTNNVQGDFVALMGPVAASDSVVEGENALILREIIYNIGAAGNNPSLTQGTGNNDKWGAAVASVPFFNETVQTFGKPFAPTVTVGEVPTSEKSQLQGRAKTEGQFQASDQVTAICVLAGWLRPTGGLWKIGQDVNVVSPMLMMNGDTLQAKVIEFTQDNNNGTRTTLTLVNPLAMGKVNPELK